MLAFSDGDVAPLGTRKDWLGAAAGKKPATKALAQKKAINSQGAARRAAPCKVSASTDATSPLEAKSTAA
jgi:hypothetical protein